MSRRGARHALLSGAAILALAAGGDAATVTVVNLDGSGEGFNDTTAVSPVGGNAGTTLGAQRLIALQYAADLWGALLTSSVEIKVDASFDPLTCGASSATLGRAGPQNLLRDFSGAPVAGTWYPQALANKLNGSDLTPALNDIEAFFNSSVGTTCAFPAAWYYGLDGAATGAQIDFMTVALHELGHGLGFLSTVTLSTGALLGGYPDTFVLNLEDHSAALLYPAMTDAERVTASTDTGDLHWVGGAVVASGADLTSGRHASGHIEMYAPSPQKPGSSVSHFSTALSPDDVMEPAYTGPNHDIALAAALITDLGWGEICGNEVVEGGEACDDGNTTAGDCCSATCTFEAFGNPCSDGNVCTDDACDGAGVCVGTPNSDACTDGDPCTSGDQCSGGSCSGTPITVCGDGDGCCPTGCTSGTDAECAIPAITPLGAVVLGGLLAALMGWRLRRRRAPASGPAG